MKDYSNYRNSPSETLLWSQQKLLSRELEDFGEDVAIDGITKRVIVRSRYSKEGNEKKIIGKIGDFNIGSRISYNNGYYLVVSFPENNKTYSKSNLKLCNSTFPLTTTTKTIIGYDDMGRPVEDTTTTTEYISCIAETKIYDPDDNQAINLPEGQIKVTIPYTIHADIANSKKFTMYNTIYEIIGIDETKSINQVGLKIITGQKVVG